MIKKIKNEWFELRELIAKINPLVMTFFVLRNILTVT